MSDYEASNSVLVPTSFVFPSAAAPAQTAEGSAVWDTDDDVLTVGTGAGRKTLVDLTAIQVITGSKTFNTLVLGGQMDANGQSIIGLVGITGQAAANSLLIRGHITGGAAAQRDILFQTGNAVNPQALVTRMTIGSNAAEAVLTLANVNVAGLKLGGTMNANSNPITSLSGATFIANSAFLSTVDNSQVQYGGGSSTASGVVNVYGKSHATLPGYIELYTPRAALDASVLRMQIGGGLNAAGGWIKMRESVLWSQAGSVINDSTAGTPSSPQLVSNSVGQLAIYSGAGNNVAPVIRLAFSNAAPSVVQFQNSKVYLPQDTLAAQVAAATFAGTGVPNNANGADGDFYFRGDGTVAGNTVAYHKQAGAWVAFVTA